MLSDNMYLYVISPMVAAIIGGASFLIKYILGKRDKKHEEEVAERNKRRDEIDQRRTKAEKRQERTEKKLNSVIAMAVGCNNPECPTRSKLAEWLRKEEESHGD